MSKQVPKAVRANHAVAFTLVHEDPDLLVVDKPTGLVTQPGKGHALDALLNGVFALRDSHMGKLLHNLGERRDFGLLHRLDKETSGLLVIAKTPNAYDQLRRDFEDRKIDKEYLALIAGIPKPAQGVIQARLKEVEIAVAVRGGREDGKSSARDYQPTMKKVVISREGQEAITAYRTLGKTLPPRAPAAFMHLTIKTGRLHQIRAHMLFLNCHVLGDKIYLPAEGVKPADYPAAPRLCLHASRLGFKHPATGKWTHFESPLPADLSGYAARIGLQIPAAGK